MKNAVEIKNLSFSYNNTPFISNLSTSIPAHTTTVIMGESGCGKSTLLRLIAGLERPHSGEIKIFGQTMSTPSDLVPPGKRNIGYIFQNLALWPHLTVYKHIEFGLNQKNPTNRDGKIQQIASFFKLTPHLDKYPWQLSGGQRQLLALARALAPDPSLLLMDEPLTGIDPVLKKEILSYIKKISSTMQVSIIYVTHERDEALALAQEIIMMRNGQIIAQGHKDDIISMTDDYISAFFEKKL